MFFNYPHSAIEQYPIANIKGLNNYPIADIKGLNNYPIANIKGLNNYPTANIKGLNNYPIANIKGLNRTSINLVAPYGNPRHSIVESFGVTIKIVGKTFLMPPVTVPALTSVESPGNSSSCLSFH